MDLSSESTLTTALYLALSFALIPAVLLLLGKVALSTFQPEAHELIEVRRLAARLEELANQLLQLASHSYSSAPGERKALDELIRFTESAERFKAKLRPPARASTFRQREFLLLQAAYDRAAQEFPSLLAYRLSKDKFQRLSRLMEELRFYYASVEAGKLESLPLPAPEKLTSKSSHTLN